MTRKGLSSVQKGICHQSQGWDVLTKKFQSRVLLHRVYVYFILFFILLVHLVAILISKFYVFDLVEFPF